MSSSDILREVDIDKLAILRYPDPRLREVCTAVDPVDRPVADLVERMFELMFAARGVGLAAAQVGVAVRLFVASPTFDTDDRQVFVNPRIIACDGWQEEEEGCLSFPEIHCRIKRHAEVTVEAFDLRGERFEQTACALTARIVQHEIDHLDGRLLVDRMGTVAKLTHRKTLKHLEAEFVAG